MQCIPRGIFEEQPDESSIRVTPGAKAAITVFLVSKDLRRVIVYDGQHWSMDESPGGLGTYSSVGTCYGWVVCYKGDANVKIALLGGDLGGMLNELLYMLTCLNTDAKVFVKNLESAQ